MILLVGGAYQGKEGAARRMAGERVQAAYGSRDPFSAAFKSDLVLELHEYIRRLCLEEAAESAIQGGTPDWAVNPNRTMGLDSQEAAKRRVMEFAGRLERENPNAIVTCDEVGCGMFLWIQMAACGGNLREPRSNIWPKGQRRFTG